MKSNNYSQLMKKIQFYAKDIVGTVLHLYQVKVQLKPALQKHGVLTIFYTFFFILQSFMHYLVKSTLILLSLKVMSCNICIFWTGFSLKELKHLLNISCTKFLWQKSTGIFLNMLPLEVLFIIMV